MFGELHSPGDTCTYIICTLQWNINSLLLKLQESCLLLLAFHCLNNPNTLKGWSRQQGLRSMTRIKQNQTIKAVEKLQSSDQGCFATSIRQSRAFLVQSRSVLISARPYNIRVHVCTTNNISVHTCTPLASVHIFDPGSESKYSFY